MGFSDGPYDTDSCNTKIHVEGNIFLYLNYDSKLYLRKKEIIKFIFFLYQHGSNNGLAFPSLLMMMCLVVDPLSKLKSKKKTNDLEIIKITHLVKLVM